MKTYVDGDFDMQNRNIPPEDLYHIEKFMARKKFKLNAVFYDAAMLYIDDSPVEFELSIGNYGNIFDEKSQPAISTTHTTNPVFDGCFYHFLPWEDKKPCVSLDTQWEDITHRLESLNFMLYMQHHLKTSIDNIHKSLQVKVNDRGKFFKYLEIF